MRTKPLPDPFLPAERSDDGAGRRLRILRVFPAACAVVTIGALALLVGLFEPGLEDGSLSTGTAAGQTIGDFVVLAAVSAVGPLALAGFISLGERYWPKGMLVVAAGCGLFTTVTIVTLVDVLRSDDSTAVLALVFLPPLLVGLLAVSAAAAALVHRYRSHGGDREAAT